MFSLLAQFLFLTMYREVPGRVLLEDLGGGVRRASRNPYPISD